VLADFPDRFSNSGHEIRTFPAMTGTDGFYVACLKRALKIDDVADN